MGLAPRRTVFSLGELSRTAQKQAGGKASALAALWHTSHKIPNGFVVLSPVYSRLAAMTHYEVYLGGRPVAVRSSAVGEDGQGHSFAGQHQTFLNVCGTDEVWQKVRECFKSLKQSAAYRAEKNLPKAKMAVLVQDMVQAQVSGVAMSCDPVTGTEGVIIEAEAGVGGVVDGKTTPHSYRGSTGDDLLPGPVLLEVSRLCCGLALRFGHEVDIEWAWDGTDVWLLQCRPITAIGGN